VRKLVYATVVLLLLGGLAITAAIQGRAGRHTRRVSRLNVALAASVVTILAITLPPTRGDHEIHRRPFADIVDAFSPPLHPVLVVNVLGNLALFAPLGAVLRLRNVALRNVAVAGFLLSSLVELAQLAIPGRTTAVDDVICNTAGAVLGYLAMRWTLSWWRG
jgi:hypothetical protein